MSSRPSCCCACGDAHTDGNLYTNVDAHTHGNLYTNVDAYTHGDTHTHGDASWALGSLAPRKHPSACSSLRSRRSH